MPAYYGDELASLLTTKGSVVSVLPSPTATVLAFGSFLPSDHESVLLINDSDTDWATVGLGGLPGPLTTGLTTTSYSLESPKLTAGTTTIGAASSGALVLPPESIEVLQDSAAGATAPAVSVSPAVQSTPGASVASTLALTVASPTTSLGTFLPGIAATYTTTTVADVLSTAGQAILTVADPSATSTGYLVNGSYSLPQPLLALATDAAQPVGTYQPIGGSAQPTTLLTYSAPVSHDAVRIAFQQAIAATDPLRTGSYSKALTFTLSTSTP
jgi:hypothetical protein